LGAAATGVSKFCAGQPGSRRSSGGRDGALDQFCATVIRVKCLTPSATVALYQRLLLAIDAERVRSDVGTEPLARAGVPCRTARVSDPGNEGRTLVSLERQVPKPGLTESPYRLLVICQFWPGCCLETTSFRRPSGYSGSCVRASPPARKIGPGVVLGCFAIFPSFASFWVRGRTGPLSPD